MISLRAVFNCFFLQKFPMMDHSFNLVSHPRIVFTFNLSFKDWCMSICNSQKGIVYRDSEKNKIVSLANQNYSTR